MNLFSIGIEAFAVLFIAFNAIGTCPVFAALSANTSIAYKHKMVLKALLLSFGLLSAFALLGDDILTFIGVQFHSFKIAGGVLLLILGIKFVFDEADEPDEAFKEEKGNFRKNPPDISVFPLGIPLLTGPATITSIVVLMGDHQGHWQAELTVLFALFLVLFSAYFILMAAGPLSRLLGKTGLNMAVRIVGIILASMACEFLIEGLKASGLFS